MRPTLLIIGSVVLVVVGFVAYILLQTPLPSGGTTYQPIAAPPPPNTNDVETQQLHPGDSPYVKTYDSKTNQLANEFRAETYTPKQDGTIDMTKPDAKFYLGGGQVLQIVGDTGNVVDPNSAGGKIQGQSQMPTRGKMQHCILKLFKSASDKDPQFTCWVNNLAFDNDTTIIATEECQLPDRQGNVVDTPADQVPVHVVGVDYDFDGRGLTIKWNERDRHLERLEIAHGEQLIIKHPNSMSGDQKSAAETDAQPSERVWFVPTMQPGFGALSDENGPIALASTSSEDAASAISSDGTPPAATRATTRPKRKKRRPTSKPVAPPTSAPVIHRNKDAGVYRATFFDNVHVTQADQTLATADRMNVDFFMNNGHASTEPSTQESAPAAVRADQARADETTTAAPDAGAAPPVAKQTRHAAAPHKEVAPASTQPDVPVIVRWTGKLVVTPADEDVAALAAGDSVLQFIGDAAPAVLDRAGSLIHCASFRYHTLDKSVEIDNSEALPIVTLLDANGTKVFAPSIVYNGADNTATIPGPARAEFPVASNSSSSTRPAARATQIAKADWTDSCTLVMQPGGAKGDMQVTEALLDGDVHVNHPQVIMNADELDLGLDNTPRPSAAKTPTTQGTAAMTTSGQLREMNASGHVDCTLHDSQGKPQRIIADHLTLNTQRDATGTDVPSELTADGSVLTRDPTQTLRCQHLIAELEPSSRSQALAATAPTADRPYGGDVQLRELTATQDVHFTATDGSFADADNLHVYTLKPAAATTPADQEIELMGQPWAKVGDKQNSVTGPIIHYNPGTKEAIVIGAGTIHGVQSALADSAHPGATSRPIDVAWQKRFAMHGNDNRIEILGDVQTTSIAADGTKDTALSDRVNMTLIDAPPVVASTVSTTAPTSAPSTLVKGSDANFMKDKLIDTVTLLANGNDNIQVSSIARDASGAILHAMNLFATTAIYDKTHDKFIVPVPGRMLVRDYRSTATTAPADASAGGMHGTSAFQWTKSLIYDQREDQAVMSGDVQVVHEAPGTAPYQMWADTITAYMDPNSHAATHPATGMTTGPSGVATTQAIPTGEDAMKVRRMVAQGQVRMISQRLQFLASQAVYDPQTQVMTARGSQREPGEMLDEQGLSTASFDGLRYNTASGQVQLEGFNGNMRK